MHFSGTPFVNLPFLDGENLRVQITENYRYNWLYGSLEPIYFIASAKAQVNKKIIFF